MLDSIDQMNKKLGRLEKMLRVAFRGHGGQFDLLEHSQSGRLVVPTQQCTFEFRLRVTTDSYKSEEKGLICRVGIDETHWQYEIEHNILALRWYGTQAAKAAEAASTEKREEEPAEEPPSKPAEAASPAKSLEEPAAELAKARMAKMAPGKKNGKGGK